jgi:hypothetical protein
MLQLIVTRWGGPTDWDWSLLDETGEPIASHRVRLESAQAEASLVESLYANRWRLDPDPARRAQSEDELLRRVGAYLSRSVFGPIGEHLLIPGQRTVAVVFPPGAQEIVDLPLELSLIAGEPLPFKPVTLCYCPSSAPITEWASQRPQSPSLRILAVFSMPSTIQPLALAIERQALVDLVSELGRKSAIPVDLRVLQYGATYDRVRAAFAEQEGWDVVHISGHGTAGTVLLETAEGGSDPVSADELEQLLEPTSARIKLVVLSTCESAAAAGSDTLGHPKLPGVGCAIAEALSCAVLAMRYPVSPEFAALLTSNLYRRLLHDGLPLDQAMAEALLGSLSSRHRSSLALATPVLLGENALDLRLDAFAAVVPAQGGQSQYKRAFQLPRPSALFVGNMRTLSRLNEVIRPDRQPRNALVVGMPGVGKSCCVLELTQVYATGYDAARWTRIRRPGARYQPAAALLSVLKSTVRAAQQQCSPADQRVNRRPGTGDVVGVFRQHHILLIVDDVQRQLSADGTWLDPEFGMLIDRLIAPGSSASVVIISDRLITPAHGQLDVVPVTCLTNDETTLLVRAHDASAATGTPIQAEGGHAGFAYVLLGGHPGLIRSVLQAPSDAAVNRRLQVLERGWQVMRPRADAEPAGKLPRGLASSISAWCRERLEHLPGDQRLLLCFVASLERPDRHLEVIESCLETVCSAVQAELPDLRTTITSLTMAGLIDGPGPDGKCTLQPGVSDACRQSDPGVARATAVAACAWWNYWRKKALQSEPESDAYTEFTARVIPYRLRLGDWAGVLEACEIAGDRDKSPDMAARLIPFLVSLFEASTDSYQQVCAMVVHGRELLRISPDKGLAQLEAAYDRALSQDQHAECFGAAKAIAGFLSQQDPRRAFGWLKKATEQAELAGVGQWVLLALKLDHARLALAAYSPAEAAALAASAWQEIRELESKAIPPVGVRADSVRLEALEIMAAAAAAQGEWDQEADADEQLFEELTRQGSPLYQTATAQLNAAMAFIRAGHFTRARPRLLAARNAFNGLGNQEALAETLRFLAECEYRRHAVDDAIELAGQALRSAYQGKAAREAAEVHEKLATYLADSETRHDEGPAHLLASAVIALRLAGGSFLLLQQVDVARPASLVSMCLARQPDLLPSTYDELCLALRSQVQVDLSDLIGGLPRIPIREDTPGEAHFLINPGTDEEGDSVTDTLTIARLKFPPGELCDVEHFPHHWQEIRDAAEQARNGDKAANERLRRALDQLRATGWAAVADAVRDWLRDEPSNTPRETNDPVSASIIRYLLGQETTCP